MISDSFSRLPVPPAAEIRRLVSGLRQEIALAKDKRAGIDAAIKSREQRLARLEAQLVLSSPALPAPHMFAGR